MKQKKSCVFVFCVIFLCYFHHFWCLIQTPKKTTDLPRLTYFLLFFLEIFEQKKMASLFQTLRRRKSRTSDPFGEIEREDTDIEEMESAKEQLREGDTYSIVLPT